MWPCLKMSRPWAFLSVRSGHPWLRWSKSVSGKTVDYARRWEMPWYIHVISVAHYFFALHQIDIQSLKRASLILLHKNREILIFCTDQPKNLNGFLVQRFHSYFQILSEYRYSWIKGTKASSICADYLKFEEISKLLLHP